MIPASFPGVLLSDSFTVTLTIGATTYRAEFPTVAAALDALDTLKTSATSLSFQPAS